MRIFTAGLLTETNTFAPWPTGLADFEERGLYRGNATVAGDDTANVVARTFKQLALSEGHTFVESVFATADPSGRTLQTIYESLRDEILHDLRRQGPFDVVLLYLHGAMVAFGYDDCEADIARRVREIVGPRAAIGVELDPHCHLSQGLIDAADCVILMKEYPHVDYAERARELYSICTRTAAGEIRPTSALFNCRMLGFYPTTSEPMAGLVADFRRAETQPDVLSVSFAHGFPWGDTADTGSKMLVVTQNNPALAARMAAELGRTVYERRVELRPKVMSIAQALELAPQLQGLVVLGDSADNPGGGSPGDNVAFLREMLCRNIEHAALGCIWDPMAVRTCMAAGVGAAFTLRIGGKAGAASGEPLDHAVTVKAISPRHSAAGLGSSRTDLGAAVWIECGGIDVVLASTRTQTFAPDAFSGLGIDVAEKRLIVVKSSQHYYEKFSALTKHLINVTGAGAIQMDFAKIPYRKLDTSQMFPINPNPL